MPTPPPVIKRYYPTLASVVSMDDFPESLGFLKKAIESLFSKIHYKDLQYKKSPKGDAAFYSLSIVSNKLAIELFGSGISLVLNPDESANAPDFNISAFPVTVEYQWKILAYLRSFDLNNFSFTPQEFFELGLIILNVSEEQAMAQFINTFTVPVNDTTLPLKQFVDDLKLYNNDPVIQSLNITVTDDTKLKEVAQAISAHTGKYATLYSFGAYLLKNDLNDTKEKLGEFFKKFIPEDIESYIKDILVPKARATLTVSAAVEFPRNILYPYVENNGVWEREPESSAVLTRFYFGKILLYADTLAGVGYKMDLVGDLRPTYSEIGKTGLLLQLEKLKLDLSDKVNIPEADADGRPVDFRGVYADALSVTLPAKWFKSGTNTNGSTLRIGGYNLLIGTGGVSGTFALEAVPTQNASNGQITDFFSTKFAFVYPIKGLKNNATTNNEEEIEITNEAGLLTYLNSLSNKSLYNFKFPLKAIPNGSVAREFRNSLEFRNFVTEFIIAENGTMWFNIGSQEKGFLIGFKKFDITFKQSKVISSNIKAALEIKKFVYPVGAKYPNGDPIPANTPVHIDIEGHLHDNGDFNLTASANPPYPIVLKDVFTYNLKSVELGKIDGDNGEDDLFYIGTAGTIQFEGFLKETMGLGPIEIERLRIYSDGSIELKGGSINLIKPIVLKLGPVEITVSAIHYGSHQKEVNGKMRKFNYFGFDGGISVDPLGIEIRGDGVKFYYCSDGIDTPEHPKPKPYLHIKTIYLDLTLPASTPVAIVNGWLTIPEPGVSKEYAGGLKLQLPKVKIAGSADMKLMPKYPAFIIDASLDFPAPIPLGPVGIYGFRGLFGYRYVAEKSAVPSAVSWYDYYKAPKRGINIQKFNNPEQTKLSGTPISIGAGASLGTSADNGTVLNIKAMVLLSIPALFMIDGRAAVLSARLGLEDTGEPPFFAFIAVGDDSLELGFGADFKMPTSSGSMLSIYADVQAGFFFKNQKPWYVNVGTKTNPVTARILTLITLKSYVMLSARGIEAGSRGEFDFQRRYGIIRVHAWAYIEVGGKISFERPQFGAYLKAGVGADIDIKFLSFYLRVDIMFGVEASKPFKIFGSFYYSVRIRILWVFKFSFSGNLSVVWEFNKIQDVTPINPMLGNATSAAGQNALQDLVRGVNMLSNEPFDLANLGGVVPTNLHPEILNKIIPIDTYIDIKTEKGLVPGSISALIGGYTNPAENYLDLVPPESQIQGKTLRQVSHKYSIEKLEVKFWNGTEWKVYHPYKAMYPVAEHAALESLKIGQFQKTDGMYNKVRLLATTPFSYTEQGQPGWFVPEQNGITAASLFCAGQLIEPKCANFELKPLNYQYYCSNENNQLFSNNVAFKLLDMFQTSYAEISDESNFAPITKSLKFDNINQMQVLLPKASVQVGLKVSNFTNGVRVKYFARYFDPLDLSGTAPLQYCNPETGVIDQPHEVVKTVAQLSVSIAYDHANWRPITRIIIEPIFDSAIALQIANLTEQIAVTTENNNLISLGINEGDIIDTTGLENQLHQLACGAGEAPTVVSYINRYEKPDALNIAYTEEFIEDNDVPFVYAVGTTRGKGLISKIAANGDLVWEHTYAITGATSNLTFSKIIKLEKAGTYIATSSSQANGIQYVLYATTGVKHFFVSINETGEVLWNQQLKLPQVAVTIQIIASNVTSDFYFSISEKLATDLSAPPFVGCIAASGNFITGNYLYTSQKDLVLSSVDVNTTGLIFGGNCSASDGSHGVVLHLGYDLKIISSQLMREVSVVHDVKYVGLTDYLVSGYSIKQNLVFVSLSTNLGQQLSLSLFAETTNKVSQLQLNSSGFYLSIFDELNGELFKLTADLKQLWRKKITIINDSNGFNNFRFNLVTERLTFDLYSKNKGGSLVCNTNKEFESCLTTTLILPSLKIDPLFLVLLPVDPATKELTLEKIQITKTTLNSNKIELCPISNGCGEEDLELCTLYNDILSIFNDCFEDPAVVYNQSNLVFPKVQCAQSILELIYNFNATYNLQTVLATQLSLINKFLTKIQGREDNHYIGECSCYAGAYLGIQQIITYLNETGNCNCACDLKNYTLLHEVCWMSIDDYEYNDIMPDQLAIEADTQATILGLNTYIQPIWRPDTSYYVHFVLRDLVNNAAVKDYPFTYGFTTGGPVGYFHTHPKATYGDMLLKTGQFLDTDKGSIPITAALNGKILEDTEGTIKNPDGTLYTTPLAGNAVVAPHPDKYALTNLSQYIDYERSYPNANGNLLSAKPLFYNDATTKIDLFFNKAYVTNFFRDWPEYNGKFPQKGMLKITIKDPIEGVGEEIVNPPALDYVPSVTTIPQTEQVWNSDDNPQVPFVLSQYSAMLNSGNNCILDATIIKPKSEFVTITPKHLKPNKLYSAIVNNMYDVDYNNQFGATDVDRLKETREVHRFVFKTSRYANFKEQVESFLIKQTIEGIEVQKEAIFKIERTLTTDQVNNVYNTIIGQPLIGFTPDIVKELDTNYQHPYDRVFEGILGLKPLDEAISTEFNVIRNLNDNKVVAIIVRNPEPFNNPKIPVTQILDTLQVLSGSAVNTDYKVLFSKDYAQAIIMPASKEITSNQLTLQFKYKIWNGTSYIVPSEDMNPSTPNLYTVTLEVAI